MQKKNPVNPQPFARLRIYRILVFQKHTVGISLKTADDTGETIPSPSGAYTSQRTRAQRRPSQLPDATASAPRHDRLWEQRRPPLGRATFERGTAFADKSWRFPGRNI